MPSIAFTLPYAAPPTMPSPLAGLLRQIVADARPPRIIATSASVDTGVTMAIASALRDANCDGHFFTIVGQQTAFEQTTVRLKDAGLWERVILVPGASLPRANMPMAWVGLAQMDDLLGQCMEALNGRPDLVVLDGLPDLIALDFAHVVAGLQGPCIVAIGSASPEGLQEVRRRIQADPRFAVAGGERQEDAFCIAWFRGEAPQTAPAPPPPRIAPPPLSLAASAPGEDDTPQLYPLGHFYSPIPSLREVRAKEARLFDMNRMDVPGVDLRTEQQMALVTSFLPFYQQVPFPEFKQPHFRYFYENDAYAYSDAVFLYCMLRHLRPRRLIEVGSGYSSCVTMDTNERFLGSSVECTFIEPFAGNLLDHLFRPDDRQKVRVIQSLVQDVPLHEFAALESGDVLFIDSTHVSKVGSDVNHLLFEVLPSLKAGVYIHFHDVFFPFEYPKNWIYQGRTWTEDYLLRAFLQYNSAFEVVLFNTYLEHRFPEFFAANMPLCLKNLGGSLWLRKVA